MGERLYNTMLPFLSVYTSAPIVAMMSAFSIHFLFKKIFKNYYPDWSDYKNFSGDVAVKLLYIRLGTYLFCCVITAICVMLIGHFISQESSVFLDMVMVLLGSLPLSTIGFILIGMYIEHKYVQKSYDLE